MDYIALDNETIKSIAHETAKIVVGELKKDREEKKEMVSAEEAARILGISKNYLRNIKDRFRYVRSGGSSVGRLLFEKDSLMEGYIKGNKGT